MMRVCRTRGDRVGAAAGGQGRRRNNLHEPSSDRAIAPVLKRVGRLVASCMARARRPADPIGVPEAGKPGQQLHRNEMTYIRHRYDEIWQHLECFRLLDDLGFDPRRRE